jgi:hypothetical protein
VKFITALTTVFFVCVVVVHIESFDPPVADDKAKAARSTRSSTTTATFELDPSRKGAHIEIIDGMTAEKTSSDYEVRTQSRA